MGVKVHTMKVMLKEAGADRVSAEASKALSEVVDKFTKELIEKIIKITKISKRKTVEVEDVEFVTHDFKVNF